LRPRRGPKGFGPWPAEHAPGGTLRLLEDSQWRKGLVPAASPEQALCLREVEYKRECLLYF